MSILLDFFLISFPNRVVVPTAPCIIAASICKYIYYTLILIKALPFQCPKMLDKLQKYCKPSNFRLYSLNYWVINLF